MGDDDLTPVRRISTQALDLGAIAAEDLASHLRRSGVDVPDPLPAGWIERVASWMLRAQRRLREVERERDQLKERLESVEAERNRLAIAMHRGG